jgi:hypothetical protein
LDAPQAVRASVRFGFAIVLGASPASTSKLRRRRKSRLCNIDHTILPQRPKQVTDRIEKKLEELPNLEDLKSYPKPGESVVFLNLKDSTRASDVPGLWYQVRKKVGDIKQTPSKGVQGPFFNDEFGDTSRGSSAGSPRRWNCGALRVFAIARVLRIGACTRFNA